jgi:hypothetical protein
VEVDRSRDRKVAAAAGTAVAAVATAGTVAIAAAVAAPVILVAAPLGLFAGARVAASGRGRATAVADEVDRVLDAVDDGVSPTRLRTDVVRRMIGRPHGSIA